MRNDQHVIFGAGPLVLYQFEQPFVLDHSKYQRAFGNQSTPHRKAIRRTLGWYRGQAVS